MQTVTASRRRGTVAYVTKPFGREMVLQALRRATTAAEKAQQC